MPAAITVENLSKKYLIRHQKRERYTALRDVLAERARSAGRALARPFRGAQPEEAANDATREEFWALKDVNFEIKEGDRVGIIGRNGAGKSTLLKILSRVTEPTAGRISIRGRVASLLEVGTGFHPELTGGENIYLNGAILGMSRAEIARRFDEIVAFAEIEQFLDTPVKRYSSGMYLRLAFAVAAHLDPEILIVDEVLAVGDAEFQRRCLGKMSALASGGRTVLFVSHNMGAVAQLTSRGIVLDSGRVVFDGLAPLGIDHYSRTVLGAKDNAYLVEHLPRRLTAEGHVILTHLAFTKTPPLFKPGERVPFRARTRARAAVQCVRFGLTIVTIAGSPVGTTFGPELGGLDAGEIAEFEVVLELPNLAPGSYCVWMSVGRGDPTTRIVDYDIVTDVLPFEVVASNPMGDAAIPWHPGWGAISLAALGTRRIPVAVTSLPLDEAISN